MPMVRLGAPSTLIDILCPLDARKEWTHCNNIEVMLDGSHIAQRPRASAAQGNPPRVDHEHRRVSGARLRLTASDN